MPLRRLVPAPSSVVPVVAAAVVALAVLASAPAAAADTPTTSSASASGRFTPYPAGRFTGDLTGDGRRDRLELGYLGAAAAPTCAVQVRPALGSGTFGPPVVVVLPVRRTAALPVCPDLGVVLPGPQPAAIRLATTFSGVAPAGGAPSVQVFGVRCDVASYTGGFQGVFQPSTIATEDLNGDGLGDVWETSNQGGGMAVWVRGLGWHQLYATPSSNDTVVTFVDLNHNRGTDILVSYTLFGIAHSGAAAVDGLTGATQVLASGQDPSGNPTSYQVSTVHLGYDRLPDLKVVTLVNGSPTATRYFRNESYGGTWRFVPIP